MCHTNETRSNAKFLPRCTAGQMRAARYHYQYITENEERERFYGFKFYRGLELEEGEIVVLCTQEGESDVFVLQCGLYLKELVAFLHRMSGPYQLRYLQQANIEGELACQWEQEY